MLVSALGATLVGFALLVLALATGTLWLAVACIVICVLGALLLLADTLGFRPSLPRRRRENTPDASASSSVGPDESSTASDDAPTEQFERVTDETVVTLGDDGPAETVEPGTAPSDDDVASAQQGRHERHGRHEQPDTAGDDDTRPDEAVGDSPPRRGRHGSPD